VKPLFARRRAHKQLASRLCPCAGPAFLAACSRVCLKGAWGQAQRSNALLFHHDFWQSRLQSPEIHLLPLQRVLPLSLTALTQSSRTRRISLFAATPPRHCPSLRAELHLTAPTTLRTGADSHTNRKHAARRKRQLEEDILQRI
jgi:hypothetical protein